jgi:general secretion pathway protein D
MQLRSNTVPCPWRRLRGSVLALLLTLAGCEQMQQITGLPPVTPKASEPTALIPPPRQSGPVLPPSEDSQVNRPPVAGVYPGTGRFVGTPPRRASATQTAEGDVTLNFVNADVRDVARAVLGEILKLNYVVAPNVQGTVTLQTSRPIARANVITALESALRFNDIVLFESGGSYRLMPSAEAPRQGAPIGRGTAASLGLPGFGVEVVPLRFVNAEEMQRMLEQFVPQGAILRADSARNLLILAGTEQERGNMMEYIAFFDVDWLAGMSFGLFPLRIAEAKAVVGELSELLGTERGPTAGTVRLVPIERMNAILAISTRPTALAAVQTWVDRLDRGNERTDRQLYVYYVQNGRAADLAAVLSRAFTGQSGAPTTVTPRDGNGLFGGPSLMSSASPGQSGLGQSGLGQSSLGQSSLGPTGVAPVPQLPGARPSDRIALPSEPGRGATPTDSTAAAGSSEADRLRITADETNNALLVLATAREYAAIEAALRKLDVMPLQVMIEAVIAEVSLTDDLRYGVQTLFQSGNFTGVLTGLSTPTAQPQAPGLSLLFAKGTDIRVVLNLIEAVTNVTVISSPKLIVLNNQTATLQVGDQVPIATSSAVSVLTPGAPVVNTIQFRDTGVILKVTPRVNESGLVLMDIAQEVSDVAATTTSSLNSPTIQQRRITSAVAIRDRETVALGGLIRDNRSLGTSGIPMLQDIPVVGALFSDKTNLNRRTELLVFITPRVIRGQQDAREITEDLRRRLPGASAIQQRP